MPIVKRDNNELRLNSILLLPKSHNPDYYAMLFKNTKSFFYGMQRPDLVEDLNYLIKKKIEEVMGADIQEVIITYKNLPSLNSFTRSKLVQYQNINIYKFQIQRWLDEIEEWLFQKVLELEPEIRFTLPAKTYI